MKKDQRIVKTMGTIITLTIFHDQAQALLDQAEAKLLDYNERFSANREDSMLMEINKKAGISPVAVDEDLYDLIRLSKKVSLQSEGRFNAAIGPIIKLWNIGFSNASVPTPEEVHRRLKIIDPHKIILNDETHEVYLEEKGMEIDLGAIAKGYFADQLKTFFKENGVESGIIDLGGNVLTIGGSPEREDGHFRVGIQNPFKDRNEVFAVLKVRDQSVVTSGIYERTFTDEQGKTYHHIFDSQTGYPKDNDIASLTIVSEDSVDGEIWTTILFALDNAKQVFLQIEAKDQLEGIVVDRTGQAYVSKGLQDKIFQQK